MFSRLNVLFHEWLHSPLKILGFGLLITFIMLTFDGSLWRFWSLQRGQEDLQIRMADLREKAQRLEFQIHQAGELTYIERQATDQFDYVREGDLIFVFSE
jgi:cell division protein FtsB